MTTALLLCLALHCGNPEQDATDRKIYTVATAHLDTNWLWTIQDTIREHIPKTLDDNFALFEKYPDYVFNFEGAIRYMLVKEYYPERYSKLKKVIADGRWKVSGSWVDAVDANMPSPEALIRQCLYGNGFFQKEFGKRSADVFLPDCFGFPYSLPTIAKHCGLLGFSTQKLYWGSAAGIPFPVGRWQGVDGSSIVAALDPGSYDDSLGPKLDDDPGINKQIDTVGNASGAYVAYRYHGTGDTGGAPAEASVKNLEANIAHPGKARAISAASDQLYRDITPAQFEKLPSYDGELLLTTHGTGCYTSQAAMKKWNRENENLAGAAETSAAIADWLGGAAYPKEKLTAAWTRFLWHEFHDDLTGTSIPTVYPFSWNDEVLSLNAFNAVTANSLSVIAAAADTSGDGIPLVVYNPVSAGRVDAVEANVAIPGEWKYAKVLDADGVETPSQVDSIVNGISKLVFVAKTPSVGFAVYHVVRSKIAAAADNSLVASTAELDSRDYKVKLSEGGDIVSIVDKSTFHEQLTGPIHLELRDDPSPNWPAWEILYKTVTAPPRTVVGGPARIKVIEAGPARVGVEIQRTAEGSTFTQRIYLSPGNGRIDCVNHVGWHSRGTLLKADFPLAAASSDATYDLGIGAVERGVDTEKKYEVPGQKWADQTTPDATFGTSILTDCKYGWDKPDDGHLRLTLLHTPKPDRDWQFQATNDLGEHDFTYSIYGHPGDWRNGTWRAAAALNQPVAVVQAEPHKGRLPDGFSLVDPGNGQVQVVAVKKAETGEKLIVRVFEKNGQPMKEAKLSFCAAIKSVDEVNGQEDPIPGKPNWTIRGKELTFELHRFQPRAFAVVLDHPVRIRPVTSHPLILPFDTSLVGTAGAALPTGLVNAIPAELFPKSIEAEGIQFEFGSAAANAVSCSGQTIALPKDATRVELLATSLNGDAQATFDLDGPITVTVPSFTERIAQWTNRVVDGKLQTDQASFAPAYLKRTPVAWIATHRLDAQGQVEPYLYCYVFKLSFYVPKGATALTLPNMPSVKVLAATAVNDPKLPVRLTHDLYD